MNDMSQLTRLSNNLSAIEAYWNKNLRFDAVIQPDRVLRKPNSSRTGSFYVPIFENPLYEGSTHDTGDVYFFQRMFMYPVFIDNLAVEMGGVHQKVTKSWLKGVYRKGFAAVLQGLQKYGDEHVWHQSPLINRSQSNRCWQCSTWHYYAFNFVLPNRIHQVELHATLTTNSLIGPAGSFINNWFTNGLYPGMPPLFALYIS